VGALPQIERHAGAGATALIREIGILAFEHVDDRVEQRHDFEHL